MERTKKKRWIIIVLALLLAIGFGLYWFLKPTPNKNILTIYGNIDIRQVMVAFYDEGRIQTLHVQEGDHVKKGQLLAELDPVRIKDSVASYKAQVGVQEAQLKYAEQTLDRYRVLAKTEAVSQQDLDNAVSNYKSALHTLESQRAQSALSEQQLIDSKLYAPHDGIIQTRILEPGDMVTPQNPVFSLALENPVWARAFLNERSLGLVQLGSRAWIKTDSYPGERFEGWLGYISPVAEFTPKTVETTELRTALMYQVRVYSCNPSYRLRLGMPVTVEIPLENNTPLDLKQNPCGVAHE